MNRPHKFTAFHRILHWTIAHSMLILFLTGFLRMKWMNKKHIVASIEAKTLQMPLSSETMASIAKSIRAPMWEWHELFSKIMIAAFVVRIAYMILAGIRFPNPFSRTLPFKDRMQGVVYIYFYVFVFISAITGIAMEYGLLKSYGDTIEMVHKWGLYWFPIFIVLHFSGIVIAEMTTRKGIASKMIGGD